ncbi:unnamed protein product [Cuscuta europaea]|uniref:Uncharacterized protein n=1 Tax=Cuscuta europaea TaxID=41803 RepID=A0A9P1EEM2_CUSEU|nr:unnamed protein product [Cuscuta europaea]
MEEEIERLKRDRNLLVTEIVKLRQQQQKSRVQITSMEERIGNAEKKQHQTMNFLAKIFTNPSFVQQYLEKYGERKDQQRIEIGQKRRLTMSPQPSAENLQDVASSAAMEGGDRLDAELAMETEMDGLFSTALMDNGSSSVMGPLSSFASTSGAENDDVPDSIWEELMLGETLSSHQVEQVLVGNESEANVEIEDLVVKETPEWSSDFQDLVDHMGEYLKSHP